MLKRTILSALMAGTVMLGSQAKAADLLAIITPSFDNPFYKAEADGAKAKA
jgi:erythritol transport system substrate-binding protein